MEELHTDSIDGGHEANYVLGHVPGRGRTPTRQMAFHPICRKLTSDANAAFLRPLLSQLPSIPHGIYSAMRTDLIFSHLRQVSWLI
jgi:hypothetical protein